MIDLNVVNSNTKLFGTPKRILTKYTVI